MEEFLLWLQENLGVILTGTGLSALAGYISYWFTTKVVPRIINSVVNMFAKLVSNLFGVSYGEGQDLVNELPIVQNLRDVEAKIVLDAEMKLLELKQKLSSPAYTAAEKMPIQATFNYIYNKFKSQLSPEVLNILQQFEETANQ
jgi:hypothetical protein